MIGDLEFLAVDLRERLREPQNILTDPGLVIVDETRVDADAHDAPPAMSSRLYARMQSASNDLRFSISDCGGSVAFHRERCYSFSALLFV
jgi:hypothetical protein